LQIVRKIFREEPKKCIHSSPSPIAQPDRPRKAPHDDCTSMPHTYDLIVIGGGLVGGAIAWGAASAGATTALIDEGDIAFRAARSNFGLVWVQSKGAGMPPYAHWTRRSADLWPAVAAAL